MYFDTKSYLKSNHQTPSKNTSHAFKLLDYRVSPEKIQRRPWKNIKQGFYFSKEI